MTELEKLQAGLPYCFTDPDIEKIKKEALRKCQVLNAIDILDVEKEQRNKRFIWISW